MKNTYIHLDEFQSNNEHPASFSDLFKFCTGDYKFYIHAFLSYGDYDNSCDIERANVRWFEENIQRPDVWTIYGGYGSTAILFAESAINDPEIMEIFDGLENYPVIDEMLLSEVSEEMKSESWEAYGERDFIDECEKNGIDPEKIEGNLYSYYLDLLESENKYVEIEAGGVVYFPNPFK